jgi:hypothetical protein
MPNVYVEPRPKGCPEGSTSRISSSKIIPTRFSFLQNATRSDRLGQRPGARSSCRWGPTFERQKEAGSLAVGLNVEHYRTLVASRRDDLSTIRAGLHFCE